METLPGWVSGAALVVSALAGLGGVAAMWGAVKSGRQGVRGHELEARRDELTAEDRLIGRLEARVGAETLRADRAEAGCSRWERRYRMEYAYAETLRRRLWEANDRHNDEGWWPPPPRHREDGDMDDNEE